MYSRDNLLQMLCSQGPGMAKGNSTQLRSEFLGGDENVLELVVIVAHFEYNKYHWNEHFKGRGDFVMWELYLNKIIAFVFSKQYLKLIGSGPVLLKFLRKLSHFRIWIAI